MPLRRALVTPFQEVSSPLPLDPTLMYIMPLSANTPLLMFNLTTPKCHHRGTKGSCIKDKKIQLKMTHFLENLERQVENFEFQTKVVVISNIPNI
jgi:hypothetical protein